METYVIENHPQDSRVRICEDGIFQALPAKMGTGGGNVPMVLIVRVCVAKTTSNAEMTDGTVCPTILNRAGTGGGAMSPS